MIRLFFSVWLAVVFAQTASEWEADLKKNPDHLSTRIQLGNVYLHSDEYDKVIALLNPYTDQLTSQGFLALGSAYSKKSDYFNEVRVLNLLVTKEPNDYHWPMLLGQAYLKQASAIKDLERISSLNTNAIQQFRKSLALSPKFKPAYDILLTTLLQIKANQEAREILLEGIRKFGDRPELYRELCRLDAGDGFLDQAVTNCREAIKIAPSYPDNYVFLVQALYDQKEDQMAETDIVSAARKFQKSEFVQWAAGTLFLKKKNYPVAARYFLAATVADPKASRSQFGLAQAQFESGQEAEALDHFNKACAADATTIDTFLSAGGKLKQKGNTKLGELYVHSAYTCKK